MAFRQMNEPVACTIVANNYLAYARVVARSFLHHHPRGRFFVLIVDRRDPELAYADEPFEVVFADELGIAHFEHLAFRYSILELSTAVKPAFLAWLHRTHALTSICYFDPDILITAGLDDLYATIARADVVLTPHITQPIDDALVPGERDFLLSGIYNLGFLGLRYNARTHAFLEWWHARLYRECLHAVERGLFVDQKWMDFAPAFLPDAVILREPGYNAAYWNAMQRTLVATADGWLVNGQPLRFFHFSGLIPDRPEVISKFQNRLTFEARPDLAALFADYRARLEAEGHETLRKRPYGYGSFVNGTRVPPVARRVLQTADPDASRWPLPFEASGPDTFLAWLAQSPGTSAIPVPRIALAIWDQRPDLQLVFPSPEGRDRARFGGWLAEHREECGLDPIFYRAIVETLGQQSGDAEVSEDAVGQRLWDTLARGDAFDGGTLSAEEIAFLTADASHPLGRGAPVPRLALMIHRLRGDLQNAFPDPFGESREAFSWWYVTNGRAEYSLPAVAIRPMLKKLSPRHRLRAGLWWSRYRMRRARAAGLAPQLAATETEGAGVEVMTTSPGAGSQDGLNVVGWATAPTGIGEACRGTLASLERAGIPYVTWNLAARQNGHAADRVVPAEQPYDVTLYHVNADMTPHVTGALPRWLTRDRHRIGYWFWELAHFPIGLAPAFHCVDEIWAPSRFCLEAYRALSPVPVRWMPPAVVPPDVPASGIDRGSLGIPDGAFLYFHAFDALSVPERKNPAGLITAFAESLRADGPGRHLLIKISSADAHPTLMTELKRAADGLPVTLLARHLTRGDVNRLLAACDCYVSLHRSEGLGLPLIEAMYLGKPVIATGYGGVTDFLSDDTGWVVRHTMTEIDQPLGPYPRGAVWADPDPAHAAELMRLVAASPDEVRARTAAAAMRVDDLYQPERFGARVAEELSRIRGRS